MSGDVVERLRLGAWEAQRRHGVNPDSTVFGKAADLITSQAAEIEVLREALGYAMKGLDMVHDGLMDPTRPRQSVGEVCAHFLETAARTLTNGGENDQN